MSLRIGRVTGLAEPTEPPGWQNNSDGTVTLNVSYRASSVTDGLVKRDQLLGLANNGDELIVPVIMDNEPRVTGYYRVVSVNFATDTYTRRAGNLYDVSVTLQPVQGFTQPLLESVLNGALLTNACGYVAADMRGFHAIPSAVTEYHLSSGAATSNTRVSADGNLNSFQFPTPISWIARFGLSPANFYVGAATVEQGNPLAPLVGRQLTQGDVANWRLSNGLLRITPNATAGKLDVSGYNGSTWSTPKTYVLSGINSYGVFTGFTSITVLRNSVEEVAIRLGLIPTSNLLVAGGFLAFLDLSLRRGDRWVRGYLTSSNIDQFKIARNATEAATSVSFGGGAGSLGVIRATANDADSNRYVLASLQAVVVQDLVNGALTVNANQTTFDFGIGLEIGGSGSTGDNTVTFMINNYLAAQDESQRIVAR